ncbi:MAG: hypothetical protein COA32_06675 [Fluviicola sp.]|nr:MAG: hypothetical protein COA32_06675 [Fluviicola sp.]
MKNNVFTDFPDDSRVWLYQTNRPLVDEEVKLINNKLSSFIKEWAAHGNQLWGNALVLNPYFVVVIVNDKLTPPSGCSIDASVHKLKEIGQLLDVDFFTRMKVTIKKEGAVEQIDFNDFKSITADGNILVYDPLIGNLGDLRNEWPMKIENSSFSVLV